jgi:rhodanese-related sulfurtransferase
MAEKEEHSPGFLKIAEESRARVPRVDVEGYKRMLEAGEPHILIDTREDNEWNQGRVKGAVHISKGIIERDIEKKIPDKDARLVLYCGGGFRSAMAADNLQRMGYTNAISLDGGWRSLRTSGLELEV